MVKRTQKYALFGYPVAHSLSPIIHQSFARDLKKTIRYEKILTSKSNFKQTVYKFIKSGGLGFNITVPLKHEAFAMSDTLTEVAKIAKAVNTIKIENNKCIGDNTDGVGLVRDLTHYLKLNLTNKRLLILGAGGAARGILLPLLKQKPALVMIANRTEEKAVILAKEFSSYGNTCGFALTKIKNERLDAIINATSASLENKMPILPENLAKKALCYDLVYGEKKTPFIQWAKKNGASQVADGTGMLIEQAAYSFAFWFGEMPQTKNIRRELKAYTHKII